MNFHALSKISEKESLRAFFEKTQLDNLNFLGDDVIVVFWSYDLKTGEWTVTGGIENFFGYSLDELTQFDFLESCLSPENEDPEATLRFYIQKQLPFDIEYEVTKRDGTCIWVKTKGSPIFDSQGNVLRYNGVSRDITAPVLKERAMAEEALQFQTLLEKSAQAVYIVQDARYQYATQQMAEITGYSVNELIGMNYDQILDEDSIKAAIKRVEGFLRGEKVDSQEITVIRKDRSKRFVELRSSIITHKGQPAMMGTLLDITERKMALERANHLAYFDTLTGLPNRNMFYENFSPFLETAKDNGIQIALLFIKLNKLHTINETFGHSAGDEVIKEAGAKIKELTPSNGFTSKYSGDEFVVYFAYDSPQEIQEFAGSVIREVPLSLTSDIKVKPAIGISLFPEHGDTPDILLRFSDIAMYQSKHNVHSQQDYIFYSPNMMDQVLRTNKLTMDLQKGLELNQFHMVYQPKVWLASEKLEGFEALIRWEHPEYGSISPMEFIPLSEKSGHIIELGEWVLETAIRDMLLVDRPLVLNVNISMRQLVQHSFTEKVKALLERSGFPPQRLNLEITESLLILDIEQAIDKLNQLKTLGIKLSLDDFGTGFSSLSYLTRLPIDCLKIDRSFVSQIEVSLLEKKLMQNIIRGARSLNMEIVAEGIETKEQANILRSFSCEKAQGYYFSKPLSFSDLLKYIDFKE